MTNRDNEKIREALSSCLSGVDALPSQRADILRAAKGEVKVKRKMNMGLILALILVLLTTTVAVAAELGLFGQIGQQENTDARLLGLEMVSTVVDKDFYIGSDVTLTVNQAYYDGSRIFISYTLEGDYQGTGVDIHDGMQIGDAYIDIIGGDAYDTEDGQRIGWKECEVPAELAADEVTFSIGSFIVGRMKETTAWYSFSLKKSTADVLLNGSMENDGWTANATLTASAIDVKGEIVIDCPKAWTDIWSTWENPDKLDYIHEWRLYVNGVKTEGHNLDGGIRVVAEGKLSCGICYKLDAVSADMKLVPVYVKAGERMEEAIVLTPAK